MVGRKKEIKNIERTFRVSAGEMRRIIKDFHLEMEKGLAGKRSSLKMIPAYAARPTGNEKGKFMALDLGGTNFRVLVLELKGNGKVSGLRSMKFILRKRDVAGSGQRLFALLARSVKTFLKKENIRAGERLSLGFTFSFPVKQESIAGGRLVVWTKGFRAKGVVGRDVVPLLEEALEKQSLGNIAVAALVNDTVGTMVAGNYGDRTCDAGVIIGTGTNACYAEEVLNIKKLADHAAESGEMIVNIEWGNFNKLKVTPYDRELDKRSDNRGQQVLEKMVSGMYLGEVCRLVLMYLIKKRQILNGAIPEGLERPKSLKSEHVSEAVSDRSADLAGIEALLKKLGVKNSALSDRRLIKETCAIVARRASRVSAASLAAVVTKMDRSLSRRHTIAVDGSVYEKHPGFAGNMRKALREIFGRKAERIKLVLTKDGSGKGGAIIAAVAASGA